MPLQRLYTPPFPPHSIDPSSTFSRGVCGRCAATERSVLVRDVEQFPGHIACDAESRSEVVVPILEQRGKASRLVAVIDIDCAVVDGFDDEDVRYLEQLARLLGEGCEWSF